MKKNKVIHASALSEDIRRAVVECWSRYEEKILRSSVSLNESINEPVSISVERHGNYFLVSAVGGACETGIKTSVKTFRTLAEAWDRSFGDDSILNRVRDIDPDANYRASFVNRAFDAARAGASRDELEAKFLNAPGIGGSQGLDIIQKRASGPTFKPGERAPILKNPSGARNILRDKMKKLVKAEVYNQADSFGDKALEPENIMKIIEKVEKYMIKKLKEASEIEELDPDLPTTIYYYVAQMAGGVNQAISLAKMVAEEVKKNPPSFPNHTRLKKVSFLKKEPNTLNESKEISKLQRLAGILK